MRHLFSVLIALVGSAVGLLLLWFATGWLARLTALVFTPGGEALPGYLALVVGVLLLGGSIAAATALSPWGAIVVGGWHLLGGLLALLWPFDPMRGVESPVWTVVIWFSSIWRETGDGAVYFIAMGIGLVAGAALLAAGLATLRRSGAVSGRAIAVALGIVLLAAAVVLTVLFGGQSFRELFLYFSPAVGTSALLLLAAALGAAGAVSARWSALPVLVVGALTTLAGIVLMVLPGELLYRAGSLGSMDLVRMGPTGIVLTLGVTVLGLGIGLALRSRADARDARRAAESPLPPPVIPAAGAGSPIG